jgi:hypothetical protein
MSKQVKPEPQQVKPEPKPPTPAAPVLTSDVIAALRSAASVEAGVKILQPDARPKVKLDATYAVNTSCASPLPQRRGACLKVVTAAVQLNRSFKVADIVAQLPNVKSAAYWTRKLAKTGHLVEVVAS